MAKCLKRITPGTSCWIGRLATSDIVTAHPNISNKHCCISSERLEKALHDRDLSQNSEEGETDVSKKYILKCNIIDHSSNGTWVSHRNERKKVHRLKYQQPTEVKVGDIIYLLAPSHSESYLHKYILSKGINKGEVVVCQLIVETSEFVPKKLLAKRVGTSASTVLQSKKSKTELETVSSTLCSEKSLLLTGEQEQCPHCLKNFDLNELISHAEVCEHNLSDKCTELVQCIHCFNNYPITDLIQHVTVCSSKKKVAQLSDHEAEPIERCMMCFCDFPLSELISHAASCSEEMLGSKERFKTFLPSTHDFDALALSVLTPTQHAAVDFVRHSSQKEASESYSDLCMKVIELGYVPKDLQKVLHWVQNCAPIIIHVNLDQVLHHFVKDTHYRNLFEVHSSGGSSSFSARRNWENNIFNNIYHTSPPEERVKYGVLNIVGDPHGVRCCYSYGDSFLQLKKVRLRTTFASMDTSSSTVKLSCCEHYGNVLNEYSDSELKAILDVATQRKPYLKSSMITHYKEVQIHGPVCFSENIDCVVVNNRHRGDHRIEKLLNQFIEKNNCNLIWMTEDTLEECDSEYYNYEEDYDDDYHDLHFYGYDI